MRKFILAALAVFTLAAPLAIITPADAATDRRACVTRGEFLSVHRGNTGAKVRSIFDTGGYQLASYHDGYYEWEWVEDGYWDSYYYDGEWYDEWIDTSYEDSYWVSYVDTVRSYKKCPGWNHGRGRVGINFDNYSSAYSGMRVWSKHYRNPSSLIWWQGISTFARSAEPAPSAKPTPQGEHEAKPEVSPLTPDPHPNGSKGAIPQH